MPIKDKDTPITIKSTDGTALEARVFLPATAKIGAVVAHPCMSLLHQSNSIQLIQFNKDGPLGGDLHNNLVSALTAHLASLGIATLRFNFRGVGNSHGRTSWTAKAEEGDFEACARYLIERDVERVVLVGYVGTLILLFPDSLLRLVMSLLLIRRFV